MVHLHTGVHMFVGFWMQHFQTGGLGEMVRHPGHHDRRISLPLTSFYGGMLRTKCFRHQFQILQIWRQNNRRFCYNNWRHVGEHVERNWLSIRRSPCNKRSTCWNVLMCYKETSWVTFWKKKKVCFYSTYSSFLVINVCNQGKTLRSPCIMLPSIPRSAKWHFSFRIFFLRKFVCYYKNLFVLHNYQITPRNFIIITSLITSYHSLLLYEVGTYATDQSKQAVHWPAEQNSSS